MLSLLSNPGFLVLDEPFNGLDIEGVVHIRELILKLSEEYGTTFLISGHIAPELEKICTHTAVIHEVIYWLMILDGALKFHPSLEDYYLALVREAEGTLNYEKIFACLCCETKKLSLRKKYTVFRLLWPQSAFWVRFCPLF